MAVINRMQHRQPCTMAAVCIRPKLMLHLVAFKIHPLAQLNNTVLRHCGLPHQIAPGRIILRFLDGCPQVADYAPHERLRNIIGYIVLVRPTELSCIAFCFK